MVNLGSLWFILVVSGVIIPEFVRGPHPSKTTICSMLSPELAWTWNREASSKRRE